MKMENFRRNITRITVSDPIKTLSKNRSNSISKSSSIREFGKVISYKDKKEYEQYRRI